MIYEFHNDTSVKMRPGFELNLSIRLPLPITVALPVHNQYKGMRDNLRNLISKRNKSRRKNEKQTERIEEKLKKKIDENEIYRRGTVCNLNQKNLNREKT